MPLAQAAAPKVIGILNAYHPNDVRESLDLFDRAMLALGYAKGTHYVTIERMASGRNELLRGMAEELVRSKVDVICAAPSNAVAEARPLRDSDLGDRADRCFHAVPSIPRAAAATASTETQRLARRLQ